MNKDSEFKLSKVWEPILTTIKTDNVEKCDGEREVANQIPAGLWQSPMRGSEWPYVNKANIVVASDTWLQLRLHNFCYT